VKDTVLVTGAAGFIGSNIARALVADGYGVVVSDWFGQGRKWRNLIDAELRDAIRPDAMVEWLDRSGSELSAVVHMGAISSTTEVDVDLIVERNIRCTIDLWTFAARRGIPFIYASSAAVYGDGQHGFVDDTTPEACDRLRPLNAYGWSKLVVDKRILADAAQGRPCPPQWAGLRFFNVYGPREDHKGDMRSVVNKIFPDVRDGKGISLFKSHRPDYRDGEQLRDFVHVDDCVAVVRWLLSKPMVSGIFNCGTGNARSFKDLASAVFTALRQDPRISYNDMPPSLRKAYQYHTEADLTKLRAAGFDGQFLSLERGIAHYVEWMSAESPGGAA
jgi:ADP-L-glycero-D-manno-heptose 6-epimerase